MYTCHYSLTSGEDSEEKNPPKFSIANGFGIGDLPQHQQDVTITERRSTSLASFRAHTVIARGGQNKFTESHRLVFSSQPDKIREEIDRVMDGENKIWLSFTNPMIAAQKRMTTKRYEARREKVNGLLEFYMKNNIQYKSLNESGVIAKMPQISDELNDMTIIHAVEEPEAAAEVISDQSNVRRLDLNMVRSGPVRSSFRP